MDIDVFESMPYLVHAGENQETALLKLVCYFAHQFLQFIARCVLISTGVFINTPRVWYSTSVLLDTHLIDYIVSRSTVVQR